MNTTPDTLFPGLSNISIAKLVSSGVSGFLVITVVVLIFVLLGGGVAMIASGGGDPQKAGRGRAAVTGAVIGLVIVFGAWAIMSLLSKFFGINLFRINIPGMMSTY